MDTEYYWDRDGDMYSEKEERRERDKEKVSRFGGKLSDWAAFQVQRVKEENQNEGTRRARVPPPLECGHTGDGGDNVIDRGQCIVDIA